MTLRNAFEDVASDGLLRRLINNLNYARDVNDRMRVVVDTGSVAVSSGTVTTVSTLTNIGLTAGAFWTTGGPNSMDQRESARQQARMVFTQRRQMWTF